ncbi:MAG TPA: hypothetical protein VHA11_07285 [Bryobacteraceae bacterium]|nr:hypothetical protein [Bryobacteraceae bacterium]
MQRTLATIPVAAMLTLAGQLFAGGFWLQLGNPEASGDGRAKNAVLTVKAVGCHNPEAASVTATAIGGSNGERRSIPLRLERLSEPGLFALTRQWPATGRWVVQLVGRNTVEKNTEIFTYALVGDGPGGVDRSRAKFSAHAFQDADIDAMLAGAKVLAAGK